MEAIARLRNVPMSARIMRLVVDLIRGKKVDEALNILKYNKKEASVWIEKLLLSAIANWEHKNDMTNSADEYGLFVKTVFVDEGTYLKRFRPAPHGRALPFRRKTNHTTIIVENKIALQAEVEEKEING